MDIRHEAKRLIEQLAEECRHGRPISHISTTVYDTAWVSMVSKTIDEDTYWLFPESFNYVLDTQNLDGGWGRHESDTDRILNTMAGLLALLWHRKYSLYKGCGNPSLDSRISGAEFQLRRCLANWEPKSSESVDLEIICSAMLDHLSNQNIHIDFPGENVLASLNQKKQARFNLEQLYSHPQVQLTIVHCLEAFAGKVDFDNVGHHKSGGGMMASPSSTAAYLIYGSTWDDEAETYLRGAMLHGAGKGHGSVPSVFPSNTFELSGVLSTLLETGISLDSLGAENVTCIADALDRDFSVGNGTVGLAPGLLADADDTAKTMIALSCMGRKVRPDRLISEFDTGPYFLTNKVNTNPSVSTNSNVLLALLHLPDPYQYAAQISRIVDYLCSAWNHGNFTDKWNTSTNYAMMLLTRAFVQIFFKWNDNRLDFLSQELIRDKMAVTLTQLLVKVLLEQQEDGSWGDCSCDITAYAVLTLTNLFLLPWTGSLSSHISIAINRGREFLDRLPCRWNEPSYIWIDKVLYCSPVLCQTYCLAALFAASSNKFINWSVKVETLFQGGSPGIVEKMSYFFFGLPLFCQEPRWKLTASVTESLMLLPALFETDLCVFPRCGDSNRKHIQYVPFTWIGCNNLRNQVDNALLWDMMLVSLLTYQIDEFVETIVTAQPSSNLEIIKASITRICQEERRQSMSSIAGSQKRPSDSDIEGSDQKYCPAATAAIVTPDSTTPTLPVQDIESTLYRFVNYFTSHPRVTQSPPSVQLNLRRELCAFLLAHFTQLEDSRRLASQPRGQEHEESPTSSPMNSTDSNLDSTRTPTTFLSPASSYYTWVHTTSADHTSCPFVFTFYTCLIAPTPGIECFTTVEQQYVAQDVARRLSTMCRMYNDYGSVARDRAEGNLNSLNFPEFARKETSKSCNCEAATEACGCSNQVAESEQKGTTTPATGARTLLDENVRDVNEKQVIGEYEKAKKSLFWLAEYERRGMDAALQELGRLVADEGLMEKVRLFVDVTDLYGQMYVARDLTERVK
ncbi:hypothetical protein BDR22DRAFT_969133 [Usnea florida]